MALTPRQKVAATTLGCAVFAAAWAPLAAYAATTANSTIRATVGSTISITSLGTVPTLVLNPGAGAVESRQKDTITVNCNSTAGYTVTLANTSASESSLVDGANEISAHTGTKVAPTVLANNTWGFALTGGSPFSASYAAVSNETGSTDLWAGVPLSGAPVEIVNKNAIATNDATDVWYGAKVTSAQPMSAVGYAATVVYSATAK